jgi:hypothetical protein
VPAARHNMEVAVDMDANEVVRRLIACLNEAAGIAG